MAFGLIPLFASGPGSKSSAPWLPVIGGLITATALTLLLPILYLRSPWRSRRNPMTELCLTCCASGAGRARARHTLLMSSEISLYQYGGRRARPGARPAQRHRASAGLAKMTRIDDLCRKRIGQRTMLRQVLQVGRRCALLAHPHYRSGGAAMKYGLLIALATVRSAAPLPPAPRIAANAIVRPLLDQDPEVVAAAPGADVTPDARRQQDFRLMSGPPVTAQRQNCSRPPLRRVECGA